MWVLQFKIIILTFVTMSHCSERLRSVKFGQNAFQFSINYKITKKLQNYCHIVILIPEIIFSKHVNNNYIATLLLSEVYC